MSFTPYTLTHRPAPRRATLSYRTPDACPARAPYDLPLPPTVGESHRAIEVLHEVDLGLHSQYRGQKTLPIGMQAKAAIGECVQRIGKVKRRGDRSFIRHLHVFARRNVDPGQHQPPFPGSHNTVDLRAIF